MVTAPELARRLGVEPKRLRDWLRRQARAGHQLLATHQHYGRWEFTEGEAEQLATEFRAGAPLTGATANPTPARRSGGRPRSTPSQSRNAGHRVVEDWMGAQVDTLEDLLSPDLSAVCVGINPSPVSVAAGHYYQGRLGQQFYARLRQVGLLRDDFDGYEDDAAFAAGIGFTDIVKRPTASADQLTPEEFEHGRRFLLEKLERYEPAVVIFTFKKTAEVLFGRFSGNGFMPELKLGEAEVFVMPGPYEAAETTRATLDGLAKRLRRRA